MDTNSMVPAVDMVNPNKVSLYEARTEGLLATNLPMNTREEKAVIYNALQVTDKRVDDNIGKKIKLVGYICQPATSTNEDGTVEEFMRVMLVDKDGGVYGSSSSGMFNALNSITQLVDPATWPEEPITVELVQQSIGKNRLFTLKWLP